MLNFSDEAALIDGVSVHCYNVDFRVRKTVSACNVGIEVKSDLSSWDWKKAEASFKIKKYEEIMGAPCLLLVMSPYPQFYGVCDEIITPFATATDAVDFVNRVS